MGEQVNKSLRLKATKQVIGEILSRNKGNNFVQCSKCGSLCIDLRELSMTVDSIRDELHKSEDDDLLELEDQWDGLFDEIVEIGFHEDYFRNPEYAKKWDEENEYRYSQKLSDKWGDVVYFKPFRDVVLKNDDKCGCFKAEEEK